MKDNAPESLDEAVRLTNEVIERYVIVFHQELTRMYGDTFDNRDPNAWIMGEALNRQQAQGLLCLTPSAHILALSVQVR